MLNKFAQMQQMMKKMGKFQKMARMGGGRAASGGTLAPVGNPGRDAANRPQVRRRCPQRAGLVRHRQLVERRIYVG